MEVWRFYGGSLSVLGGMKVGSEIGTGVNGGDGLIMRYQRLQVYGNQYLSYFLSLCLAVSLSVLGGMEVRSEVDAGVNG